MKNLALSFAINTIKADGKNFAITYSSDYQEPITEILTPAELPLFQLYGENEYYSFHRFTAHALEQKIALLETNHEKATGLTIAKKITYANSATFAAFKASFTEADYTNLCGLAATYNIESSEGLTADKLLINDGTYKAGQFIRIKLNGTGQYIAARIIAATKDQPILIFFGGKDSRYISTADIFNTTTPDKLNSKALSNIDSEAITEYEAYLSNCRTTLATRAENNAKRAADKAAKAEAKAAAEAKAKAEAPLKAANKAADKAKAKADKATAKATETATAAKAAADAAKAAKAAADKAPAADKAAADKAATAADKAATKAAAKAKADADKAATAKAELATAKAAAKAEADKLKAATADKK